MKIIIVLRQLTTSLHRSIKELDVVKYVDVDVDVVKYIDASLFDVKSDYFNYVIKVLTYLFLL